MAQIDHEEREQLAEALASDLATFCERHKLTAFIEVNPKGEIAYHLLQQQAALALILDDWQPSAAMH